MSTEPTSKLTPAMKQFHHYKKKYPECVLFFRMGDFYEMFYEDAKIASRVLGLALTSRSKGDNAIPLAGIPYHALDNYLSKMVNAGHRVAICEQVEDPRQAKGVVKREVVRVVTPGTLTDEGLLPQRGDNFLAAVYVREQGAGSREQGAGLAWVDVSTGQFCCQAISEDAVMDELVRIRPAEVLAPDDWLEKNTAFAKDLKDLAACAMTPRPGWLFEPSQARETLLKHFRTANLMGFGLTEDSPVVSSAGAVIDYLRETQKAALDHITTLRPIQRNHFLHMDPVTLRSLEIERTMRDGERSGTFLAAIDATACPMGARMLRNWCLYPLRDLTEIASRQDAVADLVESRRRLKDVRDVLKNLSDLERIIARITTGRASPRDLIGLGRSLGMIPKLKALLEESHAGMLTQLGRECDVLKDVTKTIRAALADQPPALLRDGGFIRDGFNEELDRLRGVRRDGRSWLARYQAEQVQTTGIANLRVGFNKVFGYYIEVSHSQREKVPPNFTRKQTLKNAERYITPELKTYESEALTAEERAKDLELELFEQLRRTVAGKAPRIQVTARSAAVSDALAGLAHIALQRGWRRPEVVAENVLEIEDGKHPVLETILAEQFVPNDTATAETGPRVIIITGPNMSGKSTYIRQTALLTLLAQMGSFIPARRAKIGVADRIFTRVGASDELTRGQSTFMVEMIETANILNNATERSLIILDEIGRGTSTYDGLSLAWAITEHLANTTRARTLFATHYHELIELGEQLKGAANYNVAVREWADEVIFLHKIVPGGTDESYGIHVARLAGIPREVIARAREVLPRLEGHARRDVSASKSSRDKSDSEQLLLFDDGTSA